jgi:hypothetical protein
MTHLRNIFISFTKLFAGNFKSVATYGRIPEPIHNVKHYNIRDGFWQGLKAVDFSPNK